MRMLKNTRPDEKVASTKDEKSDDDKTPRREAADEPATDARVLPVRDRGNPRGRHRDWRELGDVIEQVDFVGWALQGHRTAVWVVLFLQRRGTAPHRSSSLMDDDLQTG
jgi:hypothetical protein